MCKTWMSFLDKTNCDKQLILVIVSLTQLIETMLNIYKV